MITSLEKWISHINTYMWNVEKWYWWTYVQGRNGDSVMKNGPVDPMGDGKGGMSWESGTDVHELPCIKWIAGRNLLCGTGLSSVLCDNLGWDGRYGGREAQEAGDVCSLWLIHVVVQWKLTQHCGATILPLKIIFFNVGKKACQERWEKFKK